MWNVECGMWNVDVNLNSRYDHTQAQSCMNHTPTPTHKTWDSDRISLFWGMLLILLTRMQQRNTNTKNIINPTTYDWIHFELHILNWLSWQDKLIFYFQSCRGLSSSMVEVTEISEVSSTRSTMLCPSLSCIFDEALLVARKRPKLLFKEANDAWILLWRSALGLCKCCLKMWFKWFVWFERPKEY